MSNVKQKQHEKRYDSWTTLNSKGRSFRKEIIARNGSGWKAVYLQIGISNVRNFGIQWHEWKDLLLKLGYEMKIELSLTATTL